MTTTNKLTEIQAMIAGVLNAFPDTGKVNRRRTNALKACQWRLRGPNGEFVGLRHMACSFVPEASSFVFDGRDNEAMKLATYERALGPLTVEIIPQLCRA